MTMSPPRRSAPRRTGAADSPAAEPEATPEAAQTPRRRRGGSRSAPEAAARPAAAVPWSLAELSRGTPSPGSEPTPWSPARLSGTAPSPRAVPPHDPVPLLPPTDEVLGTDDGLLVGDGREQPAVSGPATLLDQPSMNDPELPAVDAEPGVDHEPVDALWPRPIAQDGNGRHTGSEQDDASQLPAPVETAVGEDGEEPQRSIADLVERIDADDVLDADDVVSEIVSLGVADDTTARRRYGMSVHGLGLAVLAHLRQRRATVRAHRGNRRAPAKRAYLTAALLRCALYLGPLSVAVAAAHPLGRVGWLVPALTFLLGWSVAQALTSAGAAVARTAGPAQAVRLTGGGFAAVSGLWCAFVWVAPAAWLGPSRTMAGVIGVGGLAALATVTAALVTRSEMDVVRWSLPCWLLAALSLAGMVGDGWAARVPVETFLPAAIVVAAVRAYRPVIVRSVPGRPPLDAADLRRGFGYLIAGAAQAACVVLLWRAGPSGTTSPAAVPLLLAVPALEALVGWHLHQVEAGQDAAESGRDYRKHVRSVAIATVAALMPPLAAGFALAAAAYRIPYGPQTRDAVLAVAAGTLLGGLLAVTFLLAARGRTAIAATLAAAAPLAVVALPLLTEPRWDPLPGFVAVFLVTDLLGLLAVAYTAVDHETRIAQDLRRPS